jgi:hypothetical protein
VRGGPVASARRCFLLRENHTYAHIAKLQLFKRVAIAVLFGKAQAIDFE